MIISEGIELGAFVEPDHDELTWLRLGTKRLQGLLETFELISDEDPTQFCVPRTLCSNYILSINYYLLPLFNTHL